MNRRSPSGRSEAGRVPFVLRQLLDELRADDGGDPVHVLGELLPLRWGQILLELRMDPPLGTDRLAFPHDQQDRKSTRLNSSHLVISYAVFCLKKKKKTIARLAAYHHAP